VKQALSLELGYEVPDEVAWAFMNPDIPTPELDLAYKRALMRGQPAILGFGIRPSEEADILIQHGFDPTRAFEGYQGVAQELPRADRMKAIEAYINGQAQKTPTNPLGEASYGLLFRALMLRDVEAYNVLQQMLSRETARFQAGGGPASGGLGLLNPELR
jgi:GT2 family glycosyltransferase